jgi:hypothetical protein
LLRLEVKGGRARRDVCRLFGVAKPFPDGSGKARSVRAEDIRIVALTKRQHEHLEKCLREERPSLM